MLRRLELDLVNNDQPTLTESVKTGTIDINTNKISSLCTFICLLLFFLMTVRKIPKLLKNI